MTIRESMEVNMLRRSGLLLVLLAISSLLLSGCRPGVTPTAEAPIAETPTAEAKLVRAAFVYWGPVADGGWTYAHDLGRLYLEENVPNVETTYIENIQTVADTERVLRQFAREGYDIIFTAGNSFMDPQMTVAAEFPDTAFENCAGWKVSENSGNFFGAMEEVRYLTGMVAGKMTKSDLVGYVAAFPFPEVIRGLNGFALGVKAVNPDAKVQVVWTNTWFDPGIEREAAEALLAAGADVLAQHQDSHAPVEAAEAAGAYAIGYDADMGEFAPDTVLTSAIWNWGIYHSLAVQRVQEGTWRGESWYGHLDSGIVDIAPFGPMVPQDVQDLVLETKEKIINGELQIIAGPIYDNEGTLRVPEGTVMTHDEVYGWDWLVDGILGAVD